MALRTAYGPKTRQKLHFPEKGRTKQAMKAECDINNIMAKFQKTGTIEFVNKREPQYGDCTGLEFQSAMETVANARELFADMPSSIRRRFDNEPSQFLDFIQDPSNREEAIKMGLIKTEALRKEDTSGLTRARRKGDPTAVEAVKKEEPKATETTGREA